MPIVPGGPTLEDIGKLLGFAEGGIVPGSGPVPVLAHGGEAILTPQMQANLMQALSGLAAGPAAFAPSPASLVPPSVTQTIRIDVGGVTVHVPAGADGKRIGESVKEAVQKELKEGWRDLLADNPATVVG